jgi:hypothetical protein
VMWRLARCLEARPGRPARVRHVRTRWDRGQSPVTASEGTCVRCGGPLALGQLLYCSPTCRLEAVRLRRAKARGDLGRAAAELRALGARVERDLATLGLPR